MPGNQVSSPNKRLAAAGGAFAPCIEYMTDAAQRSILFWDVMRQRGNAYRARLAQTAPNVLDYKVELVVDGRKLERPVNYALVRVVPPQGVEIDQNRRPFVIVDPRENIRRAGHLRRVAEKAHRRLGGQAFAATKDLQRHFITVELNHLRHRS